MFKKSAILLVLVTIIYACSSSEEIESGVSDNFDRGAMLTHLVDNIIVPSFQDFSSKMTDLKSAGETFTSSPNQINLDALRASWYIAYKEYQHVEMFNIGKAEELQYKFYMNIYPLSVTDVETNISNGSYDLDNVNYQDAQGFPVLDYLLYGVAATDEDILKKYTTDTNATGYKKYITDVLNQMEGLTTEVLNDWTTSYRTEFVNSTDNTATSALNKFLNDYIEFYEKNLRANKFGIPAGVFSSTTLPEKVEAFYRKDISKDLALEALDAFENLFLGNYKGSSIANKSSFQQYLQALDRQDLVSSITNQLAVSKTQIEKLNANFFEQVNTDNTQMTMAYDELQKLVVFLKLDMASALNISIIFVDSDGD
ncbi:imelysin family protein [Polaribacter sp. Hel1_85]|uniref:imelysin family protein n=1 Tax=Polaribacter sp. Hel1_85 TaxID=1250005 RepID=UPI00052E194E|nr:imelysin family protein [Polaribacter sp. Hel1_85]KGL63279.1 peptidase, M75 family, imelysin [Polaribacter sp. Hel1_85]